jgi:two-component system chemotaxis sensor kinase CheA
LTELYTGLDNKGDIVLIDCEGLSGSPTIEVHVSNIPKEALDEYIGETREMCERVSLNLGLVEKKNHDDETLNSIYRDMHSIKGSSHLFGFKHIGELSHTMETALDPVRHKTISVSSELIDALYAGLDLLTKMLQSIIGTGEEGPDAANSLNQIIPRIADLTIASLGADSRAFNDRVGVPESVIHEFTPEILETVIVEKRAKHPSSLASSSVKQVDVSGPTMAAAMQSAEVPRVARKSPDDSIEKKEISMKDDHSVDAGTIRIQVGLLDNLMNLVGELVLIRNQVLQFGGRNVSADFQKLSQRLNVVTSELQNDVMKTRMQPVGSVFSKFHRVVRDMSRDLGKKMELRLEGAETELDKTLIEAVKDPLTHLVRNSVDHGLENPDERKKSGKQESGRVTIRSFHEGGQVIIEVSDDGRGLSKDKIGKKALDKGLVTHEQLLRMTERDVQALIFAPGFSTADKVSDISGRGVGMDVVKTNIERIGGTIDLESAVGFGTTVRLKIPLTLAIIPALVVSAAKERFAIPQVKVVELVRLEKDKKGYGGIELLQGCPVYRLRGDLLPLVELSKILQLNPDSPDEIINKHINNIVVLQSDSGLFGLIVDEIVDSADIVVKPVAQNLKGLKAYSGATIMGDGSVVLILDVPGLAVLAVLAALGSGNQDQDKAKRALSSGTTLSDVAEYLVMDLGVSGHYAMPLCLVNRLEEFSTGDIELTGEQRVIKYRDTLLPLIPLAKQLALPGANKLEYKSGDRLSVVVISKMNRLFGFEVKGIVDVLQIDSNIDSDLSDRPGILGSVIAGRDIIVVLDALGIIDDFVFRSSKGTAQTSGSTSTKERPSLRPGNLIRGVEQREHRKGAKILLAEDTAFFRRHVKAFLESMGYQVVAVVNGDEAFKLLESSAPNEFSLVLTDIEMPLVDGFELARRIRSRADFSSLPVIALTTRFRKADIQRGAEVGFTAYLEKFNADVLKQNMDRIFGVSEAS